MTKRKIGISHIEVFRAVVLTGSMTEAARSLNTSQPQVSRLIGQLEQIVQFRMFDRTGGRLSTTLEGARFFQEVEKTFTGLAELESAADNIRSFKAERLRLTAMPRLAGGLLTKVAADFLTEHPDVDISIRSGTAGAVHDWIRTGLCDVGIAMLYGDADGVQMETVAVGSCVAILPKDHELSKRAYLTPTDFKDERFIGSPNENQFGRRIDEIFLASGIRRDIRIETDLGASVCRLVGAGVGLSIINPLAAFEERESCGIVIKPFSPQISFSVALIYPPYTPKSLLITAFSKTAQDRVKQAMSVDFFQ